MFKFFLILLKVLKHFTNVLILNQKSNNSGLCKSVIVLKLLSILQFYLKNCSSILITSEFIKISLAKDDNKVTVEIQVYRKRSILLCNWSYGWEFNTIKNSCSYSKEISRHAYFILKEGNCKIAGRIYSVKYCFSSILDVQLEIPLLLDSKVPDLSHTQRCRTSSLCYIHTNAEDKNPDEDT